MVRARDWFRCSQRLLIPCVAAVVLTGCAARERSSFATRFVKPGEPTTTYDEPGAALPQQSLDDYGRRLRSLQSMPRTKATLLPTIESRDPLLRSALHALAVEESAENHRMVAAAYRSAGVLDYAYRHYQRALRLDHCDSASHEGLARLWREWKRPELALGDVYRAIHCRPHSASAYNTLGTILLALDQRTNARHAFEFALRLDGGAAFALNNLCYLSLVEGNGAGAQRECERALTLEPALAAARTNLALAHAIQGDVAGAEWRLLSGPDQAAGQYNVGILRMSLGRYSDAADAFELASRAEPGLADAARRAVQARAFAAAHKEQ
jgi:Flp pilus assembly protein TadD